MRVRFGPSGLPRANGLVEGLRQLKSMGFDACELDFVDGFWMNKEEAEKLRPSVEAMSISLRAHAPFYATLTQSDPLKAKRSVAMIHHTANLIHLAGGEGITVHPGFLMGRRRDEVLKVVRERLKEVEERLERNAIRVTIGIENVGNAREFGGSIDDVIEVCRLSRMAYPVIDWAHVQSTCDGCLRSEEDYMHFLSLVEKKLGREALEKTRYHFSAVEYSEGLERRHLSYRQGDMNLQHLLDALCATGVENALIISESPDMDSHLEMLGLVRAMEAAGGCD